MSDRQLSAGEWECGTRFDDEGHEGRLIHHVTLVLDETETGLQGQSRETTDDGEPLVQVNLAAHDGGQTWRGEVRCHRDEPRQPFAGIMVLLPRVGGAWGGGMASGRDVPAPTTGTVLLKKL